MTFDTAGALWFVLETSARAFAAAAAVGAILWLLRMRAPTVRHAAWTAVLFAMLLMPVLPSIVPAFPVPVPATASGLLGAASSADEQAAGVLSSSTRIANRIATMATPRPVDAVRSTDQAAASVTPVSASRPAFWLALLAVYVAGVLVFVTRLVHGWLRASAMIRRATRRGPIRSDLIGDFGPVYESPEVTVPMTVGAVRPVIVLPVTWRAWDAETLTAIVAHEAAHVGRHDASIGVAARLNRAIFWFHPLAWWLERTLAVTAEHACDDVAARAIGAPHRYAGILVDMADVVRRNGGRLAWQAVGVSGAGLLDRRIDRLLRGDAFASVSRGKKAVAGVGCILALATAVACRQQIAVAPLRENPEVAKMLAYRTGLTTRFNAARDMTQEQAEALEQRIVTNPDDFDVRLQLVTYYRTSSKVAWDKKVPGLRRHALWLIEHHPQHEVEPPPLSPQFDPEGFAAAKRLWDAHLAKSDVSPFLVYRAAAFFGRSDKPYAEQLIRRGMAMDQDSAGLKARMPPDEAAYEWPVQLSSLYAAAIRGSESVWGTYNDLRTHAEWLDSPYAMQVRRTLDATTDAKLLTRVGETLVRPTPPSNDPAVTQALEQARALGVRYLERALELDPALTYAKAALVRTRRPGQVNDAERLANRAQELYMGAEGAEYYKRDAATAKQRRDEAKASAERALEIAATHAGDPAYSAGVMTAHHVLATVAMRDGDRERTIRHLRDSVKVPASEQIQYTPPSFLWGRPVNQLLKAGERERVAEFLEAYARLSILERDGLLRDAQAIREGRMPYSYQSMVAREGQ